MYSWRGGNLGVFFASFGLLLERAINLPPSPILELLVDFEKDPLVYITKGYDGYPNILKASATKNVCQIGTI
jgi:hypothetical protein